MITKNFILALIVPPLMRRMKATMILAGAIYFIGTFYAIHTLQLRITPRSFLEHQTMVAANFPLNPPITVELINETTGLLEESGPNSNLSITAVALNASVCPSSDSIFNLSGGVGEFRGSLCEVTNANASLIFKCNSTLGPRETNFTRPIAVTGDIHLAYYRPDNEETLLNDCLEKFMYHIISCLNSYSCAAKSFSFHLPNRSIIMKSYKFSFQDRSGQVKKYLDMKEFHRKYPEKRAYAIIGMNDNLASKTLLPLMENDKYSVTSYRQDDLSEFDDYPYFNRIHPSENYFMDSVFLYFQKRKWNKVIFIYPSHEEMDYTKFVADRYKINLSLHKIDKNYQEASDYKRLFMSILKSGYKIIITSVTGRIAKTLIMEANKNNVTSVDKFQWIGLRNEKYFNFLLENEPLTWDLDQTHGLINERFKGMLFINTEYPVNLYNNSRYRYILYDFFQNREHRTCMDTYKLDGYAGDMMPFASAHDVILAHVFALKRMISGGITINGISLSQSIRANRNFTGMTGEVVLNSTSGSRDNFIGSIYILWPDLSYFTLFHDDKSNSYYHWKAFGHKFFFNIMLMWRKDSLIIGKRILTQDLLMYMLKKGLNESDEIYNGHIPLSIWNNGHKSNVSILNKINVTTCHGYFHDKYQMLVQGFMISLYLYNWYSPEIIKCDQQIIEKDIITPFYCESGCGGLLSNPYDALNFTNGECVYHNVCKCSSLWSGDNCTQPVCHDCDEYHGVCIKPGICNCSQGYMQPNCSLPSCPAGCNGTCVKPGICECDDTHFGESCLNECTCKHGLCDNGIHGSGKCKECDLAFYGEDCLDRCTCKHGMCDNGIHGNGKCKECDSAFYGEDCDSSYIKICLYIILPVVGVLIIVYIVTKAYEKELRLKETLTRNDWVINWADVKKDDIVGKGNLIISAISMSCDKNTQRKSLNIGKWDDIYVYYQKLDKDGVEISREIQLEIKQVRDMKHSNIVPLIGCSVHAPNVAIFTQLQNKGSVKDILLNDDIEIPWKFRFSMMKDICKGLSYIHSTSVKSHGRLKSSNCLVDNKWTVKLSGFGLPLFRSGRKNVGAYSIGMLREAILATDKTDYESLLWTSPEILCKGVYHIDHVGRGSVHGDIYSFGMVLSEFCTMKLPFADLDLNRADLINLIAGYNRDASHVKVWNDYIAKNNFEEGGLIRPCIQDKQLPAKFEVRESLKNLIENCWDEDPRMRPSCKECEIMLYQVDSQRVDPMEHLITVLETYSTNLENVVHKRNEQLQLEVKKTDDLVSRLLPKIVAEDLKQGKSVESRFFETVTIFFSNIEGLSSIAGVSSPKEVISVMNDTYALFDSLTSMYDIYKVEVIGHAYMFVSGLPPSNSFNHAEEICTAASYLNEICSFSVGKNVKLRLQVGIHTGSVIGAIVGLKSPKYCIFGDTVEIAVKMESTGKPSFIHISEDTYQVIQHVGGFNCIPSHEVKFKSSDIKTYWMERKKDFQQPVPAITVK